MVLCLLRSHLQHPHSQLIGIRYDSAMVSMAVASQERHFPPSRRMNVTPAGHLQSEIASPLGSFEAGIPVFFRPRQNVSFRKASLAVRPGPRLHDLPIAMRAILLDHCSARELMRNAQIGPKASARRRSKERQDE